MICYNSLLFALSKGEDLLKILMLARTISTLNISVKEEKRIGKKIMNSLLKQKKIIKDKNKEKWAQNIFNRVKAFAKRQRNGEIDYKLTIFEDKTINAFALPGGYIVTFTGLINEITSDDEIACIFGHEITHVERRHSLKLIRNNNILSSLILLGAKSSQTRSGLSTLQSLSMLEYSREDEREADIGGIQLSSKAGYNAYAMVNFLEKLLKIHGDPEDRWKEILMTHPLSSQRAQELIWKINDNKESYNIDKIMYLSFAESREITFKNNILKGFNNGEFSSIGIKLTHDKSLINTKEHFEITSNVIPIEDGYRYVFKAIFNPHKKLTIKIRFKFFDKNKKRLFPDYIRKDTIDSYRTLLKFTIIPFDEIPGNTKYIQINISGFSKTDTFILEKWGLSTYGRVEKPKEAFYKHQPKFSIEGLDKL